MYNSETEVLFPLRFSLELVDLRDAEWKRLIEFINSEVATRADKIAFILMMVRLNGCVGCNADSYRAMRGCATCAKQAIKRSKLREEELLQLFDQARKEIASFTSK